MICMYVVRITYLRRVQYICIICTYNTPFTSTGFLLHKYGVYTYVAVQNSLILILKRDHLRYEAYVEAERGKRRCILGFVQSKLGRGCFFSPSIICSMMETERDLFDERRTSVRKEAQAST